MAQCGRDRQAWNVTFWIVRDRQGRLVMAGRVLERQGKVRQAWNVLEWPAQERYGEAGE